MDLALVIMSMLKCILELGTESHPEFVQATYACPDGGYSLDSRRRRRDGCS